MTIQPKIEDVGNGWTKVSFGKARVTVSPRGLIYPPSTRPAGVGALCKALRVAEMVAEEKVKK